MGASSGRSLGRLVLLLGRTDGMAAGAVARIAGRFRGGIFLEKRLLKLAKRNKTETINSTAGDTNIPREPLLSGKLLGTWERQFKIYIA